MPQDQSRFQSVISKLKTISKGTTKSFEMLVPEIIQDAISDQVKLIKRSFSNRLEMAGSVLPPVVKLGLSKLFSKLRTNREDDSDDSDDVEATTNQSELEDDALGGLAEIMADGFEETNENLDSIFEVLSGVDPDTDPEAPTLTDPLDVDVEPSDVATIVADGEQTVNDISELVEINGEILDTLQDIKDNTKVNELQEKVKAHNANKAARAASKRAAEQRHSDGANGQPKNSIVSNVLDTVLKTALGTAAGLGGYKALFGTAKGKVTGALKGLGSGMLTGAKTMGAGVLSGAGKALGALKGVRGIGGIAGALSAASLGASATVAPTPTVTPTPTPATTTAQPTRTIHRDAKGRFTSAANAVSPPSAVPPAAPVAKAGMMSKAKSLAGKALGTPLLAAVSAYEAYNLHQSDASDEEKNSGYTKIAGGMSGALAGAAVGAMTGPFAPVAVPLLGALGYFGGDYLGGMLGDAVFKKESADSTTKEKVVSLVTDAKSNIDTATSLTYKELMKPEISPLDTNLSANDNKLNRLNGLTQQFDAMDSEKQEINAVINQTKVQVAAPQVAQQNQSKQGMTIPSVRNQDGTIQRLLDSNFSPMFK